MDISPDYYLASKITEIDLLKKSGKPIIDLSSGNPDLPPDKSVIDILTAEAIKDDAHKNNKTGGSPILRKSISDWYKLRYDVDIEPEHEVLPLSGSKEGITFICNAYLSKGDEALVPDPCYPVYDKAVAMAGGKVRKYRLYRRNNWYPDIEEIEQEDLRKVKIMFINYPHMPTGQVSKMEIFKSCIEFAEKYNIILVNDNAYSNILTERPLSIFTSWGVQDNVIELNTLSKSHNMSGWRVGMLCGARDRLFEISAVKRPMDGGIFSPIQLAAVQALSLSTSWYDELNTIYSKRRKVVFDFLDHLGCHYQKPASGTYIWAECPPEYKNGYDLSDMLLYKYNIFVLAGGVFGNEGLKYIRVGLCTPDGLIEECHRRISLICY